MAKSSIFKCCNILILQMFLTISSYSMQIESKSLFYKGEYLIGIYGESSQAFDSDRITHFLVPGSAKNSESNQFFQSAIARARKYRELYPQHQVIFITAPEVKKVSNEQVFRQFQVTLLKKMEGKLTGPRLLKHMSRFSKIASFDFYGHSSPWALKLGKHDSTLGAGTGRDSIVSLRGHFIDGAYATLNSCNAGIKLAPALSMAWEIPVSGAMSGSVFERIHDDGRWYNHFLTVDLGKPNFNTVSFDQDVHCYDGACWRMKPMNSVYDGYWGEWNSGLSFYKFFCNYEDKNSSCEKGMATSLFSLPSTTNLALNASEEEFKQVVYDQLCPTGPNMSSFDKCVEGINQALLRGDNIYSPFRSNPVECSFKKCDFQFKCRWSNGNPKAGSCRLSAPINKHSTTIVREFKAFLKGFSLL